MDDCKLHKITSVVGMVIWTDNLSRLLGFYKNILKLPVHSEKSDFVSFDFGAFRFNIGTHDRVGGDSKDPYRVMVHFEVSDIHSWHEYLNKQGVEFIRKPEIEHWGGSVATFKDPDGNILQMLEFQN
ncbi:MAG TPA: hypothetical protein DEZ08_07030 [Dehalococcoidia bacterium]|jgi:lactoylglutathione lyase|nr:hypothetical protein [Dehalococcoidia bacterium]|tara:strand:- start:255 stop:635 length:381 start_codon:yes stop_codon:yes gene_type:complete